MAAVRSVAMTLGVVCAGGLGFFAGIASSEVTDDISDYPPGDTSLVYISALDRTVERDQAEGIVMDMDEGTDTTLIPVEP